MRNTRARAVLVASLLSAASLLPAQGTATDSAAGRRAVQGGHDARGESGMDRRDRHEQHGDRDEMRGVRGRHGPLAGIRLSEAERVNVKAIRDKARAEGMAVREALEPVRREARAARDRGDSAAVRAAWERGKADRERLLAIHERARADVRGALTPEHQTQFDANVARMKARRDEREKQGLRRPFDDDARMKRTPDGR